jgi:hypothetical protein
LPKKLNLSITLHTSENEYSEGCANASYESCLIIFETNAEITISFKYQFVINSLSSIELNANLTLNSLFFIISGKSLFNAIIFSLKRFNYINRNKNIF